MTSLVLHNAHIWTGNPAQPFAEALAVVDGTIQAIGTAVEIEPFRRQAERVIDADGATVVPGFIDTHVHLSVSGLGMLSVDLSGVDDIGEALRRIARASGERPPTGLLPAINFQPELNPENRFPSPFELDAAAGGRPVYVMDRSGHWSAVNQAALYLLQLPAGAVGIQRDTSGQFTGVLTDQANSAAFEQLWPLFAQSVGLRRAYELAAQDAARGGITTVHALDDLNDVRLLLTIQDQLPVRVVPYTQTKDVTAVQALGLHQIGGCGPVMVDGDFSPHTAALLDAYADQPVFGRLYYSDQELAEYVLEAHRADLQIGLHCVGSGAIEQLLNAYELTLRKLPKVDHRFRIEHFELPALGQAERARRLGVVLAVQPAFNHYWPHDSEYPQIVGPERALQVDPLRRLDEAGLIVALGSDSPVTPMRPLLWLHSAVNHSNPVERVSVERALRMATWAGAYLAFEEKTKGTLQPGNLADFVILSGDPMQTNPELLKDLAVWMTVVGGNIVYNAGVMQ